MLPDKDKRPRGQLIRSSSSSHRSGSSEAVWIRTLSRQSRLADHRAPKAQEDRTQTHASPVGSGQAAVKDEESLPQSRGSQPGAGMPVWEKDERRRSTPAVLSSWISFDADAPATASTIPQPQLVSSPSLSPTSAGGVNSPSYTSSQDRADGTMASPDVPIFPTHPIAHAPAPVDALPADKASMTESQGSVSIPTADAGSVVIKYEVIRVVGAVGDDDVSSIATGSVCLRAGHQRVHDLVVETRHACAELDGAMAREPSGQVTVMVQGVPLDLRDSVVWVSGHARRVFQIALP